MYDGGGATTCRGSLPWVCAFKALRHACLSTMLSAAAFTVMLPMQDDATVPSCGHRCAEQPLGTIGQVGSALCVDRSSGNLTETYVWHPVAIEQMQYDLI